MNDDCAVHKAGYSPHTVWTHVWIAVTLEQARQNRIVAQKEPNIPNTIYLKDVAESVVLLSGYNVRYCDVHGWPKNEVLARALRMRLLSRGCTFCKQE